MSNYEKQNFEPGQILTAAQLNHIEEGISKILPVIEEGETLLVTDKEGNLVWEDKNFKKEESLELLFPEFQVTGVPAEILALSPLIEVEHNDGVIVDINGVEYNSFINWIGGESTIFNISILNNGKYDIFGYRTTGDVLVANRSGHVGTVKIKVLKMNYSKIDPNYLPLPSIEGTGKFSILLNRSGTANGNYSAAANGSTANGDESFAALGGIANGICSFVCGHGSQNSEDCYDSIVLGGQNKANKGNSYILGNKNQSNTDTSYILGNGNEANSQNSYILGYHNINNGVSSTTIGYGTTTSGYGSRTFGYDVNASGSYQTVLGKSNIVDTENKYLYILGNGRQDENEQLIRSNAHTIDWDGNAWFSGTVEGTTMIIKSPNGTRFQITVSDDGTLSAAAITE